MYSPMLQSMEIIGPVRTIYLRPVNKRKSVMELLHESASLHGRLSADIYKQIDGMTLAL